MLNIPDNKVSNILFLTINHICKYAFKHRVESYDCCKRNLTITWRIEFTENIWYSRPPLFHSKERQATAIWNVSDDSVLYFTILSVGLFTTISDDGHAWFTRWVILFPHMGHELWRPRIYLYDYLGRKKWELQKCFWIMEARERDGLKVRRRQVHGDIKNKTKTSACLLNL